MSIGQVGKVNNRAGARTKRRALVGGRPVAEGGFAELIEGKAIENGLQNDVNSLMAELADREEELTQRPTQSNFFAYKNKVRQLIKQLLPEGYRIHSFKDRSNRQYEIVRIIDQKLAGLFAVIVRRNPDLRFILRTMGEVRGLLLDEMR